MCMSIRPGVTISPAASTTSRASPPMLFSIAATLPSAIATSRTSYSPSAASITVPPLMSKSYNLIPSNIGLVHYESGVSVSCRF